MGGFGLLWALLKSLRYLLPFLKEVTDEEGVTDDKDLAKIRSIKELLALGIWRFIYIVIMTSIVWFAVIPLYSKNEVLLYELEKANTRIAGLIQEGKVKDNDSRKLRDELVSRNIDIKNGDSAYKRLLETLNACRDANADYRHYVLSLTEDGNQNVPAHLVDKAVDNANKANQPSPTSPELSDDMKRRIQSYHEGD